jgi:hypothetical protein
MMPTPQKQTPGGNRAMQADTKEDETNSAGCMAGAQLVDDAKQFARAEALAAFAGCSLYRLADSYLLVRVSCTGFARELADLRAVHAMLAQIGGRHG